MRLRLGTLPATFLLFAGIRLVLFALAADGNLGDACCRIGLSFRWLADPTWPIGYREACQYGPLHLPIVVSGYLAWPSRFVGPRLPGLLFGILIFFPFHALARRLFGARVARWSCVILALFPLHLQASTLTVSEAPFLFLLLLACERLFSYRETGRLRSVLVAGLAMSVACGIRYNGWPMIGVLALTLLPWGNLRSRDDWRRALAGAPLFALIAVAWPLLSTWTNYRELGRPLAALQHITAEHARYTLRIGGEWLVRAFNLGFWLLVPLIVVGPWLLIPAAMGLRRGRRLRAEGSRREAGSSPMRRSGRAAYLLLTILPLLPYLGKGVLLGQLYPLVRFVAVPGTLLIPWLALGVRRFLTGRSPGCVRRAVTAYWVCQLGYLLLLSLLAWLAPGESVNKAVTRIGPLHLPQKHVREVAAFLGPHYRAGETVALDRRNIDHIEIEHLMSGSPTALELRGLAPAKFDKLLLEGDSLELPGRARDWLVVHEAGRLGKSLRISPDSVRFTWAGRTYRRVRSFGPYRVYRAGSS